MVSQVSAFERKLSANPEAKANYDALSDRAKRVLIDHFAGLKRDVVNKPFEFLFPKSCFGSMNFQPTHLFGP